MLTCYNCGKPQAFKGQGRVADGRGTWASYDYLPDEAKGAWFCSLMCYRKIVELEVDRRSAGLFTGESEQIENKTEQGEGKWKKVLKFIGVHWGQS